MGQGKNGELSRGGRGSPLTPREGKILHHARQLGSRVEVEAVVDRLRPKNREHTTREVRSLLDSLAVKGFLRVDPLHPQTWIQIEVEDSQSRFVRATPAPAPVRIKSELNLDEEQTKAEHAAVLETLKSTTKAAEELLREHQRKIPEALGTVPPTKQVPAATATVVSRLQGVTQLQAELVAARTEGRNLAKAVSALLDLIGAQRSGDLLEDVTAATDAIMEQLTS